ncbi:hypothetical protein [Larkinella soli]|uniref:hypothetical protein n=1 Tax=Larkinella soli TaxID=1770527 RepID=UPI000FFBD8C9|nr:hypothetical protein [Larkinella soli]
MAPNHYLTDHRLRAGLLLFWSLYFTSVFLSNSGDALKAAGLLPDDWLFVSGNYELVRKVVGIYRPPGWLAGLMFAGVIGWQAAGLALFWQAFLLTLRRATEYRVAIHRAFALTIGLWAAFILADEFFLAYEMGGLSATHYNLLIAEVVMFILIRRINHEERKL